MKITEKKQNVGVIFIFFIFIFNFFKIIFTYLLSNIISHQVLKISLPRSQKAVSEEK